MTVTLYVLWMLCALGSVVFAAHGAAAFSRPGRAAPAGTAFRRAAELSLILAGVAATSLAFRGIAPDATMTGGVVALVAIAVVFEPRLRGVSAVAAGALAGVWAVLLQLQGVALPLAVAAAASLPMATVWLTGTRIHFAPEAVLDEALLGAALLGTIVGILPGMLDGWQAAAALSGTAPRELTPAVPMTGLVILTLAAALGGLHAIWSRR